MNECLFLRCTSFPKGLITHSIVVLISFFLYFYWTKKKALMSFRSWALFMGFLHIFYGLVLIDTIRTSLGVTMQDIFFLRIIEVIATFVTILRLYFIVETYEKAELKTRIVDINPMKQILKSAVSAIKKPEFKNKSGKKKKNLKQRIINLLF